MLNGARRADGALNALTEALARTPMFASAPANDVRSLAESSHMVWLKAGEVLFSKNDDGSHLYLVRSGTVRIGVLASDGREVTYALIKPGQLFGEIAVLDNGPRTTDATAMEDCTLIAIGRQKVLAFLEANPDQMLRMVRTLCERIRKADELLEDIFFLSLPARLAKHLLVLGNAVGENGGDNGITLKVSQQEMAEQIGIRRESVNRWLSKWEQAGLVGLWRGQITLRDLEALEDLTRPQ
jgi:CRP/FNR family cyclic AMP-dependent transcriptional regulator